MTATTLLNTLALASNEFSEGATIPNAQIYSGSGCNGDNLSPSLEWSTVPPGTKSLVVTMYDPDAPTTVGFTHWILFDLDPTLTRLDVGAGRPHHNPEGSSHGLNDFGERAYAGPCPPKGDPEHRYRISLYALDIPKLEGAGDTLTYPRLRFMIRDHILAKGMLMGRFGV
jgi:Raf kinase inhibitor-like YbhB/YbcL family protein